MQRVKCFLLRHQFEGILTGTVYAKEPDEATIAAVARDLSERHGDIHPKTEEPIWLRVQPAVLLVDDAIAQHFEPAEPEAEKARRPGRGESGAPGELRAALSQHKVTGTGTVTNPGEKNPARE